MHRLLHLHAPPVTFACTCRVHVFAPTSSRNMVKFSRHESEQCQYGNTHAGRVTVSLQETHTTEGEEEGTGTTAGLHCLTRHLLAHKGPRQLRAILVG